MVQEVSVNKHSKKLGNESPDSFFFIAEPNEHESIVVIKSCKTRAN